MRTVAEIQQEMTALRKQTKDRLHVLAEELDRARNAMLTGNEELLVRAVNTLGMSARTTHTLAANKIETLADLIQHSAARIRGLYGIGKKGLEEIQDSLATLGLHLYQ